LIGDRLEAYSNGNSRVFIAANDTDVIGFLSFHAIPLFHEAAMLGRITAMAIDPDHQREGIGSSLVSAAENFGISIGCSRMEVTSGDRREHDAHRFYLAQGYRSDCRRFLKQLSGHPRC
jgi:GNAT superfamily N-acetyltransferase